MSVLPTDLVKQFVKETNDSKTKKTSSTFYGTVSVLSDGIYVTMDGSTSPTPVSMATDAETGDRVLVEVVDHKARIIQILDKSSSDKVAEKIQNDTTGVFKEIRVAKEYVNTLIASDITAKSISADSATIKELEADNVTVKGKLEAAEGNIIKLQTDTVEITGKLTAAEANIENLEAKKIDASLVEADYATIESLNATDAKVGTIEGDLASFKSTTTEKLKATDASIENLEAKKIDTETANAKFANIDFSNIGKAAMEYFYANSGLIQNVVVGNQTITGNLVGVTISGDLIEGNTIVAEKLVIKGEDGLYYKLNTDGITTEAEQTDYNSLNGQVIRAKSITASKIAVEDLVAFDATIGGFSITDSSIYSGVKESVDNTTRGIYLDKTGQVAFGDSNSYIKYYKDSDGNYKLEIAAKSVKIGTSGTSVEEAINTAQAKADSAIISSIEQFYHSDSPTELTGGEWSIVEPIWMDGKYVWRRNKITYGNGNVDYSPSENGICITGNTGAKGDKGEDSTLLRIESSRGTVFKNDQVSTVLSVVIYHGSQRITDSATMKSVFGNGAYLQWKWQRLDDDSFGVISSDDSRFGNNGFIFTLSPSDVDTKVTFMCELIT